MSLYCLDTDPQCANDAAVSVLKSIYGNKFIESFYMGTQSPATIVPETSDIAPIILGGLATVAGMLAIVVFFTLILTNLISSAQDGEAFGKGSAKSIIVFRFMFSIMMLMPTGSQYCLAQVVLMAFVLWSNAETNKIYNNIVRASALNNIAPTSSSIDIPAGTDIYGLKKSGLMFFAQASCYNLLNSNFYPENFTPATSTNNNRVSPDSVVSSIYVPSNSLAVNVVKVDEVKIKNNDANKGQTNTFKIIDNGFRVSENKEAAVCGTMRIYEAKSDAYDEFKKSLRDGTENTVLGLEIAEQDDLYKALSVAALDISQSKKLLTLALTSEISTWMESKGLNYTFTGGAEDFVSNYSTIPWSELDAKINAYIAKSHIEYKQLASMHRLDFLTNELVKALTNKGWTYAGGIKQRIVSAQFGLSGAAGTPVIEFTKPELGSLAVDDNQQQRLSAAISIIDSITGSAGVPGSFTDATAIENIEAVIPSKIDENTDTKKLQDDMQDAFTSNISNLKHNIVSYILTGTTAKNSMNLLGDNSTTAAWLNSDRDVLANIQRTGEFISVANMSLGSAYKVTQSALTYVTAKTGWSDTVYRASTGALSFVEKVLGPPLAKVMTYLFILQTYMAVVIPSMPYFFFITGVVAWYIHILQAMAGLPFWAIMHMIPERSFAGSQTQGYITIVSLFLRPMLTLTGLFFGFILANPILIYVTDAFFAMQGNLNHSNGGFWTDLWRLLVELSTFFNWLIIYCTLVLQICYMIFGLAGTLPDTVLRWLGSGLNAGGWGETNASQALSVGAGASVQDSKLSAEQKGNNQQKGRGDSAENSDGGNGGGGGGNGGGGGGGGNGIASSTQSGVDDARASKQHTAGFMAGKGGQITGPVQGYQSPTNAQDATKDFQHVGGVTGVDGRSLDNKSLWEANKTRSPDAKAGFTRNMLAGYAMGGTYGAIKGIGAGVKGAVSGFKDGDGIKDKLSGMAAGFGRSLGGTVASEAKQGANIMGNVHFAQHGGLPITNDKGGTSYTRGGGDNIAAARAYSNLNKATK